jgi:hypothetical protein
MHVAGSLASVPAVPRSRAASHPAPQRRGFFSIATLRKEKAPVGPGPKIATGGTLSSVERTRAVSPVATFLSHPAAAAVQDVTCITKSRI